MENLKIDTGVKRVVINDGPEFIEFNPSDLIFVEKFYHIMKLLEEKQTEYRVKYEGLSKDQALGSDGVPTNMPEAMALMREICIFMRAQIDKLIGEGTSQKVFGDALVLEAIIQFFNGLMPFVEPTREKKMNKYIEPTIVSKRKKHVVKA